MSSTARTVFPKTRPHTLPRTSHSAHPSTSVSLLSHTLHPSTKSSSSSSSPAISPNATLKGALHDNKLKDDSTDLSSTIISNAAVTDTTGNPGTAVATPDKSTSTELSKARLEKRALAAGKRNSKDRASMPGIGSADRDKTEAAK